MGPYPLVEWLAPPLWVVVLLVLPLPLALLLLLIELILRVFAIVLEIEVTLKVTIPCWWKHNWATNTFAIPKSQFHGCIWTCDSLPLVTFPNARTTFSMPWRVWIAMDYAFVAYHTNNQIPRWCHPIDGVNHLWILMGPSMVSYNLFTFHNNDETIYIYLVI